MKTYDALAFVLLVVGFAPITHADTFGSGDNIFDIEFVNINSPGNEVDYNFPNDRFHPDLPGAVTYTFRMGKFEISEQMIDKANTLGQLGITKDTRGPNKPATSVNWNEAARFVNWLNTSTGNMPAYKFSLQPGQVGYDPNADIQLWTISDAGYNPNNLYRNKLAKYFLPSDDEWYKAAYYDPSSGQYYSYPTASNNIPDGIDFPGDAIFDAVFNDGGSNLEPNDITIVGVLSPFGTAGQGGNVWEWEETDFFPSDGPKLSTSTARLVRGGDWSRGYSGLSVAITAIGDNPAIEFPHFGFRIASVPEPSTLLLSVLPSLGVLARKKR